jgi:hypothetical protein
MSSDSIKGLPKGEALDWLRNALQGCYMSPQSILKVFTAAYDELERQGADPERWRGWVRMLIQRARSKAAGDDPTGLLLVMLREGCADDLSRPLMGEGSVDVAGETDAYIAEMRREREGLPANRLPLLTLMHAHRLGLDVHALVRAWEQQGCPAQESLEFPGWATARQLAEGA